MEPTQSGPSSQWARATAARLSCVVTVGYPEVVSTGQSVDAADDTAALAPRCYNSTITVSPDGRILAHYRKTHLYYTDETWAQESDTKWLTTMLPLDHACSKKDSSNERDHAGDHEMLTTFGICMDLNPHQFTAPWTLYELASHTLETGSQLLLLSMAWLTSIPTSELVASATEPDTSTLSYWIERLVPLIKNEDREIVVIFANRCGEEPEDAQYAGTSWVGKVGYGQIKIWAIAGKGQEMVLTADTSQEPPWLLKTVSQEVAS